MKTFKDKLAALKLSASDIVEKLKCPLTTAYQWLDGKRQPPEWQQPHWLKILRGKDE